jgi:hypothetical protein
MTLVDDSDVSSPVPEAGILLEANGVWSAFELASQYAAGVTSLGCPSDGICYLTVDGLAGLVEMNGTTFSAAPVELPSGSSIASIGSLSCPTFGTCIATGTVTEGPGTAAAVLVDEGGTWSAVVIPQPAAAPTGMVLHLQLGACDPTGECVVLGDDYAGDGGVDIAVDASGSASGSSWTSSLAPTPAPSSSFPVGTIFDWLQCPSSGQCVAGGKVDYEVGGEGGSMETQTFMLYDSQGTWSLSSASDAVAPVQGSSWPLISCSSVTYCASVSEYDSSNSAVVGGVQGWDYESLALDDSSAAISCVDGGTCAAIDISSVGVSQAFVQSTPGGNWALAPIANPYVQGSPDASISSISCVSASSCAAAGTTATPGLTSLVLYSMVNGTWSAALAPLPTGASPYPPLIDCAPDGSGCVADDTYVLDIDSYDYLEGIVLTFTDGSWTSSSVASLLPSDAATVASIYLSRPSCPTLSACIIVGGYTTAPSDEASLVLSESAPGDWEASTVPVASGDLLATVSCPVAGWCAATSGGNIYVLSSGTWAATPSSLFTPTYDSDLIVCWAKGDCIAAVTGTAGAVVSDRNGTWQALSNFSPFDTVSTLSCDESGNCIAAGISSLAVDSDGGAFTDVPDDEQPQKPLATVAGSSCAPSGGCAIIGDVIGGTYEEPAIVSGSLGGAWSDSIAPVVDAGDSSFLYDISCWSVPGSTYDCDAAGTEDSDGATPSPGVDGVAAALVVGMVVSQVASTQPPAAPAPMLTISTDVKSPATLGQTITFTAGFGGSGLSLAPTGNVTFSVQPPSGDSTTVCGSVPLTDDIASCTLTAGGQLAIGNNTLTATYSGDADYAGASVSAVYDIVAPLAELTVTRIPEGTIALQQSGTIEVEVAVAVPAGAPPATGIVSISGYCAVPLEHGQAICNIPDSDLKPGPVRLAVAYEGDSIYPAMTTDEPGFMAVLPPAFTSPVATTVDVLQRLAFVIRTTGFPAAEIKESGSLPKGVTFSSYENGKALLSGSPVRGSQGTYRISLTAFNGIEVVQHLTLVVIATRPSITSASAVQAQVSRRFSFVVTATGIPLATLTESGGLPKGVTFTADKNGRATLAGTPARGTQGTYVIRILASNGVGTPARQRLTLMVSPA